MLTLVMKKGASLRLSSRAASSPKIGSSVLDHVENIVDEPRHRAGGASSYLCWVHSRAARTHGFSMAAIVLLGSGGAGAETVLARITIDNRYRRAVAQLRGPETPEEIVGRFCRPRSRIPCGRLEATRTAGYGSFLTTISYGVGSTPCSPASFELWTSPL